MIEEQKPFLVRNFDEGQDILITFDFNHREEISVVIDDAVTPITLNDPVDYDIIYKFGRGYVTLHIRDEIEISEPSSLIVSRTTPQTQALSVTSGMHAPRENLEIQLDRTVMMVQDMDYQNRNAMRLPIGDPADPVLPLESERVDSMFFFEDESGGPVSFTVYPTGEVGASPYMLDLLKTDSLAAYRGYLQLWDISYKSISNTQRVLNAIPGFDTLPIFTPFPV